MYSYKKQISVHSVQDLKNNLPIRCQAHKGLTQVVTSKPCLKFCTYWICIPSKSYAANISCNCLKKKVAHVSRSSYAIRQCLGEFSIFQRQWPDQLHTFLTNMVKPAIKITIHRPHHHQHEWWWWWWQWWWW